MGGQVYSLLGAQAKALKATVPVDMPHALIWVTAGEAVRRLDPTYVRTVDTLGTWNGRSSGGAGAAHPPEGTARRHVVAVPGRPRNARRGARGAPRQNQFATVASPPPPVNRYGQARVTAVSDLGKTALHGVALRERIRSCCAWSSAAAAWI